MSSIVQEEKCLLVEDIAEGSFAWEKGVRKGDLLKSVDHKDAATVGVSELQVQIKGARWTFISNNNNHKENENEVISFISPTGCIGINFAMTVCAAECKVMRYGKNSFFSSPPSVETYWTLWENKNWTILRDHTPSYKSISQNCMASCLRHFCNVSESKISNHFINSSFKPWLFLFNAAASYELGDARAMEGILAYYFVERSWTTDFQSLVRYYAARDLLNHHQQYDETNDNNNIDFGICKSNGDSVCSDTTIQPATLELMDLLGEDYFTDEQEHLNETVILSCMQLHLAAQAFHYNNESPQIAAFAKDIGIDTSPPCIDELFPDYSLVPYVSKLPTTTTSTNNANNIADNNSNNNNTQHHVTLSEACKLRSPVILVILMFSYRTNGPYDHLMRQWIRWYQAYKDYGLRECHVLTYSDDKYAWGDFERRWKGGEDLAMGSIGAAPTAILYDEYGVIQGMAENVLGHIPGAPTTVLLRGRRVLHCSNYMELDDASVLRALKLTQDVGESLIPSSSTIEKDMAAAA